MGATTYISFSLNRVEDRDILDIIHSEQGAGKSQSAAIRDLIRRAADRETRVERRLDQILAILKNGQVAIQQPEHTSTSDNVITSTDLPDDVIGNLTSLIDL